MGVAPYPSHHARWKAQREKGVACGVAETSVSHVAGSMVSNGRRTARKPGKADGDDASPTAGRQGDSPVRVVGDTPRA